jgi:hypothetical protein
VPLPPPGSGGFGAAFGALGGVLGPGMMILMVLRTPGPAKAMRKAGATSPQTARKATTLGVSETALAPMVRSGVVVREADGRIWLDERRARRRAWRNGALAGIGAILACASAALLLSM